MSDKPVFEFGINAKQDEFFDEVMMACSIDPKTKKPKSKKRRFAYGGAIRGGKTSVCLVTLYILAKMYPQSRWHVIRDSFTVLEQTTIPSMEKFVPVSSKSVRKYNRSSSNFYVELTNGSRIFFVSESFYSDPDLTWMLGLETNGIFLEQAEGLQEVTWNKALERVGSWYIDPMPPGIILTTFNPTLMWPKQKFYEPSETGSLPADTIYINALPSDNPMVTEDQWSAWDTMDDISRARFIDGNWSAFAVNKPFVYAFSDVKNICGTAKPRKDLPLWLSFDFNRDPITCLVCQHADDRSWDRVIREFRIANSDIYELCDQILAAYPGYYFQVTGDASGFNGSAMVPENQNFYIIIKKKLGLSDTQMKVPSENPRIKNNRILVNSVVQRHRNHKVSKDCKFLLLDIKFVEVDEKGEINKKKDKHKTHLLDCYRYYLNVVYPDWIKAEIS